MLPPPFLSRLSRGQVYEIVGRLVAVAVRKARVEIPAGASFEDYLGMEIVADEVEEMPFDPLKPPSLKEKKEVRRGIAAGRCRAMQAHEQQWWWASG